MRQLGGAGSAGFRNGNHHINFRRRQGGDHPLGQSLAQIEPSLVDRHAVHGGVWTGQIHKLKNAGHELWVGSALLGVELTF